VTITGGVTITGSVTLYAVDIICELLQPVKMLHRLALILVLLLHMLVTTMLDQAITSVSFTQSLFYLVFY